MKKSSLFLFVPIFFIVSCTSTYTGAVPSLSPIPETLTPVTTETLLPSLTPSSTATPTATPEPLGLPSAILPQGWGVSIHYEFIGPTYFTAQELTLLEETHVGFVRDDIWPGAACDGIPKWCFGWFDDLVTLMSQRGIRVLFNLVGHNFEQSGTEETRKAFVEFARVAAKHFKGRGVIWELWAEPDGDWSWRPRSNPQEYALLASETIAAMKEVDPNVIILGPNVATLDTVFSDNHWKFLKAVGDEGVLTKFDAINIHLYNGSNPESQIKSLLRLRRLVDSYSPDRKIPITASELGYTTGGKFYNLKVTPEQQAQYLVRSWLVNLSHEVNLSIWYDWKDDTWGEMEEYDRHFGVISGAGEPKPVYSSLKTLTTTLDRYQFVRRIATESSKDYLLLFRKEDSGILVAWTITTPHALILPPMTNKKESIDMMGTSKMPKFDKQGLALQLSNSPQYLLLKEDSFDGEEIYWKPEGTFFRLDDSNRGEIPITIENPSDVEQTYNLQAILNDNSIGSSQVSLDPKERLTVSLPVNIIANPNETDFLVKIAITNHETTQTGWIWVQK